MDGLCPTCLDDLPESASVVLGECGHGLCRPCAVAAVHLGMEAGRPYPQCVVCADSGEPLTSTETRYGLGWLSFEALHTLQLWCESDAVTSNVEAALRGQQPVSALLVNRYCQTMLMAALSSSASETRDGLEPLHGPAEPTGVRRNPPSPERNRQRADQRRRGRSPRNFGGGGDDDDEEGGSGGHWAPARLREDDAGGGGGVSEHKSGDGAPPPPPPRPPTLARMASVALQVGRRGGLIRTFT